MSKIIVAGAGSGGIAAAIKLAREGLDVTIYEKLPKEKIGMPQNDVFESDTFSYAGLSMPKNYNPSKNSLTFVPLEAETQRITLPCAEKPSVSMDRKELFNHLFYLAEESGVKFIFNCEIISPLILGNRVVGIKTSYGEIYGDLVIDSCGIDSPLRKNLPKHMGINREIKKYDEVYTYRAYFERDLTAPQPETPYNLIIKENGSVGFSWVVTEEARVDVLICRFSPLDNTQVLKELQKLSTDYPHISKNFIQGGLFCKIPVCNPLAVLVADGYAAVGDSAFMTYAVKGSGITYAIKAGSMLADTVLLDKNSFYTAETLWEYNKRFFKEIGFTAGRISVLKNMLTYITAQEVNDVFNAGIFTSEDFKMISAEKLDMLFGAPGRAILKEKIKMVRENTVLKEKISNLALWIGKLVVTETYFPNKYDRKDIEKWAEKYNEFFDSIRKAE